MVPSKKKLKPIRYKCEDTAQSTHNVNLSIFQYEFFFHV